MRFSWSDHLETSLARISELATGGTSLRVYRAGGRVALAIPADVQVAEMVLNLYQPQRLKGRLFKLMVSILGQRSHRIGAHMHEGISIQVPEIEWLQEAAQAGTLGFLGCNPSHGLRCIVAGISPSSGKSFIVKLGFDESKESVRREYDILTNLQERYPGVIQTTGHTSGENWFAMRLPYLGHTSPSRINIPAVVKLLSSWRSNQTQRVDEWKQMHDILLKVQVNRELSGWHHKVGALSISRALVHGDFAIWNLRHTSNGLLAIDWEWATEDGIAGIDLIHALRQEAYMVKKLGTADALVWMQEQLESETWKAYLTASGWANCKLDLLRIGLLHSYFISKNDSRDLLEKLGLYV
jgi:hypothetical protein